MIVDFHSHITRNYENPALPEAKLLADMERNGITWRVVSTLEGQSIAEQNRYISDFVTRNSHCLVGSAIINPKEYTAVQDAAEALELPGIRMLEFNSFEHGYFPESCTALDAILKLALAKGVPIKAFTGLGAHSLPWQWEIYAKRYPELRFVLLHMGCFDYGYGCIDVALENPNVFVETSNQYEFQILKKAFEKLGEDKILFGSDYPSKLTRCSVNLFEMFHLGSERLEQIYYHNSAALLNI